MRRMVPLTRTRQNLMGVTETREHTRPPTLVGLRLRVEGLRLDGRRTRVEGLRFDGRRGVEPNTGIRTGLATGLAIGLLATSLGRLQIKSSRS